jgi:hypothetical protein
MAAGERFLGGAHERLQVKSTRQEIVDGPYRYLLVVRLADASGDADRRLTAILKNPSTASAMRSDPTIGKVEAWARRNGVASVAVVNLFARRATQPSALNACSYEDAVGPDNDVHIQAAVATSDALVLGWGEPNGFDPARYERRAAEVLRLLDGHPLHRVGPLTRRGYPRHGLLWNGDCALCDWLACT